MSSSSHPHDNLWIWGRFEASPTLPQQHQLGIRMKYQNRKSQHKAAPFSDLRRKKPSTEKNIYVKKHIKNFMLKSISKKPASNMHQRISKKQKRSLTKHCLLQVMSILDLSSHCTFFCPPNSGKASH